MAVRTTKSLVEEIIGSTEDSLIIFMQTANSVVNRVVTCAATKSITISDDDLVLMESWLAAYYYSFRKSRLKSKSTSDASASFDLKELKDGALQLDPSGCLAGILGQKVGMSWLGTPASTRRLTTPDI